MEQNYVEIPIGLVVKEFPTYGKDITWAVDSEPKQPTMDKKLVINVAPVGALISKQQNPATPSNAEEIADQVIAAYNEGASMFHVHVREDGAAVFKPELYKKTMDLVFEKAPDIITNICSVSSFTHEGAEHRVKPLVDPLQKFGHKYCEITPINPITMAIGQGVLIATPLGIEEECKYMEEAGVKPELAGYTVSTIDLLKEHLIDKGLAKKPYYIDIVAGVHNSTQAVPSSEGFVNVIQAWRSLPPDTVWQGIMGGRNWLPLTVLAIMLGADVIRVGMEDMIHTYPHKDELIKNCASLVKKIATIAKELGREIATPSEARKIIGLKTP